MTLEELNDKYFGLYGDLFANRSLLTVDQHDLMAKVLYLQYNEELDVVLTEQSLAKAEERFKLRYKAGAYIPRRRGLFRRWNSIAKVLRKQYRAEFVKYLSILENATYVDKMDTKDLRDDTEEMKKILQPLPETERSGLPEPVATSGVPAPKVEQTPALATDSVQVAPQDK